MEGIRLAGTFGSYREAAAADTIMEDDGREVPVKPGDRVFVSFVRHIPFTFTHFSPVLPLTMLQPHGLCVYIHVHMTDNTSRFPGIRGPGSQSLPGSGHC